MPLFSYMALNDRQERIRGLVDAISLQAARSALQESGLFVEEIHEATPSEQEGAKPWETAAVVDSAVDREIMVEGANSENPAPPITYPLPPTPSYYPLLDTLRLYAGWLLGWYILVIALGAYQETKHLPFTILLVEGLWQSVLIIRATFAVFLFLVLSSLYRFLGSRRWLGGILGLIGILLFYVFLVNT